LIDNEEFLLKIEKTEILAFAHIPKTGGSFLKTEIASSREYNLIRFSHPSYCSCVEITECVDLKANVKYKEKSKTALLFPHWSFTDIFKVQEFLFGLKTPIKTYVVYRPNETRLLSAATDYFTQVKKLDATRPTDLSFTDLHSARNSASLVTRGVDSLYYMDQTDNFRFELWLHAFLKYGNGNDVFWLGEFVEDKLDEMLSKLEMGRLVILDFAFLSESIRFFVKNPGQKPVRQSSQWAKEIVKTQTEKNQDLISDALEKDSQFEEVFVKFAKALHPTKS
jgi:hypothetical protein